MDNILELVYVIAQEKGIEEELVFEYLEQGLKASFKKQFGDEKLLEVHVSRDTGRIDMSIDYTVVEEVEDDQKEISLGDARKVDPQIQVGDIYKEVVDPMKFGRNSVRVAAQSLYQNILVAERDSIYKYYKDKEGELITAKVQRFYRGNVYVDLGKTDGIIPPTEQIPGEEYEPGKRLKMILTEVRRTNKDPVIHLSRKHNDLVKRLFELEVPEIFEGELIIRGIAREAGSRTKIAIESMNENIDTLGACVGPGGSRVMAIVDELGGEKIDIIEYSSDPEIYIENALKPAKVVRIISLDEKRVRAVVPDYQLSLAIGKEGQNARLAARLTGWRIDIKSETQMEEMIHESEENTPS